MRFFLFGVNKKSNGVSIPCFTITLFVNFRLVIRILSISKYKYAVDQKIFLQPATVLLSHALENLCLKTLIVLTTQNVESFLSL